ncbi:hypothetical protein [Actinophytocola sp.]|uniref:hypothetical protein n=1 Tax=Actinophytocola sp. TaxID=1872138 RepID=UPI002ED66FAE
MTAQIRTLEQQTGHELFTRLPRGVEATPYAHELAAQIAGPLDQLAALEGPLGRHTAPVHLAGPSELLCVRVLPALASLVTDGVQLRVTQGLPEPLLEELRAGRHDLVIATRRALESVPLADEEYLLVAAPRLGAARDGRQLRTNGRGDRLLPHRANSAGDRAAPSPPMTSSVGTPWSRTSPPVARPGCWSV